MNVTGDYSGASNYNGYNAAKTSQTSGKPFTIPTEPPPIRVEATLVGQLTFIGYGDFDPFKEIAETGSFKIPEFMQTKSEPTMSDEKILRELEKLAKEHAKTGVWDPCSDERYLKLMDEYISSVSPDRENFLKSEIDEILERIKYEKSAMSGTEGLEEDEEEKEEKIELIDYLMEAVGAKKKGISEKIYNDIIRNNIATRGNNIAPSGNDVIATRSDGYYTAVDYDRGGGRVTTLVYDNNGNLQPGMHMTSDAYSVQVNNGEVDHVFFYDDNGEMIASYHNNKLYQGYTKEEGAREQELRGVYYAAFDIATGRQGPMNPSETYKEAYNNTYDRLRNCSAFPLPPPSA